MSLPTTASVENAQGPVQEAYGYIRAGDFNKGIGILREALKNSPGSPQLKSMLAESLNAAAVNEYNKGDFTVARDFLVEAIELSREPYYFKNLANVQVKLNDISGALETLKPYASEPEIKKQLKSIYIRLGNENSAPNAAQAIFYYGKALELDPMDTSLKEILAKLQSEYDAESGMGRAGGGHFLVKFEGEENSVTAQVIALLLEEAYVKVGSDLDYYPADRIEALLYEKE